MPDSKYTGMEELFRETWTTWSDWMSEAKTDLDFYLGDQWSAQDRIYLEGEKRKPLVINKNIRRFVHLLTGYERQQRLGISFTPVQEADVEAAQQFTDLASMSFEKQGGYHQISRAFSPSLKVGLDWVNLYVDYNEDWENGDILFKRTPWTRILPDPLFQEIDGSDMSYLFRFEKITERQATMIMPGVNLSKYSTQESSMPPIMDPTRIIGTGQKTYQLMEFWQREYKEKPFLIDLETGETRQFEMRDRKHEDQIRELLGRFPQLRMIKKRKQVQTLELYIGDDLIWNGENPVKCDDIPYVPIICYYDPEHEELKLKLQGIVRALRDSAEELNKRRTQLLHAINTTVLSGWKWEEGALVDDRQMNIASGAGVKLKTKKGKIDRVKQIEGRNIPDELIRLEEMFAGDPVDITGINAELLASMEKDMPGISIQLRQNQALIIIQEIFDNLRTAKKGIGKRYQKTVQNNYGPQKVRRLLNALPAAAFYSGDFGKYDSVVGEALLTASQKHNFFAKLMYINEKVFPIHPLLLLEASDLPKKYKDVQGQYMLGQLNAGMPASGAGGVPGTPPPGARPGPVFSQGGPGQAGGRNLPSIINQVPL